jgi:hypothetical protein
MTPGIGDGPVVAVDAHHQLGTGLGQKMSAIAAAGSHVQNPSSWGELGAEPVAEDVLQIGYLALVGLGHHPLFRPGGTHGLSPLIVHLFRP